MTRLAWTSLSRQLATKAAPTAQDTPALLPGDDEHLPPPTQQPAPWRPPPLLCPRADGLTHLYVTSQPTPPLRVRDVTQASANHTGGQVEAGALEASRWGCYMLVLPALTCSRSRISGACPTYVIAVGDSLSEYCCGSNLYNVQITKRNTTTNERKIKATKNSSL